VTSGRRELLDYAVKLRIRALVIKAVLVEPKTRGLRSGYSAPWAPARILPQEAARAGG
jgi:hypothetical protein